MNILVIGDSFSFGSELSDLPTADLSWQGNCYFDPDKCCLIPVAPSCLAWPSLLENRLSAIVKNLSLPGSSNARIFRKAMLHSMLEQYDLIICAWTSVERFDFTWDGLELQLSASNPIPSLTWFKEFVANHYNPMTEYQRWFATMIALQGFFKSNNQPYLFVNAVQPLIPFEYIEIENKRLELSNQIDHDYYINWKSNLSSWCRAQGVPFGSKGHFLEEGHQLVADKMFNIITDKFLGPRDD
jgi:hypothetical protein